MNSSQHNRQPASSSNEDRPAIDPARLEEAERQTRQLARSHYENFLVASILLPRRLRQPFYNVYAYCRTADDLADESATPEVALDRLDDFQRQLDETFCGQPTEPLFVALAGTIDQFRLPKQPFDDLLSAFRQDQHKTRYASHDELFDYCRRSANPVGRIVLALGDCLDAGNAALSDQICTGLQLANFWQDVARDYKIGRIYFPADQMDRHGVNEAMFEQPSTSQPFRRMVAEECDLAEQKLRGGLALAQQVPRWLAGDVRLFAHGGLATLDAIRKIDFDVLHQRPTVSRLRQAMLVTRAAVGWL